MVCLSDKRNIVCLLSDISSAVTLFCGGADNCDGDAGRLESLHDGSCVLAHDSPFLVAISLGGLQMRGQKKLRVTDHFWPLRHDLCCYLTANISKTISRSVVSCQFDTSSTRAF